MSSAKLPKLLEDRKGRSSGWRSGKPPTRVYPSRLLPACEQIFSRLLSFSSILTRVLSGDGKQTRKVRFEIIRYKKRYGSAARNSTRLRLGASVRGYCVWLAESPIHFVHCYFIWWLFFFIFSSTKDYETRPINRFATARKSRWNVGISSLIYILCSLERRISRGWIAIYWSTFVRFLSGVYVHFFFFTFF